MSPKLLHCHDLELAVPGTYDPNQPVVKIKRVQSSLQVITSKQRPRKLSIFGKCYNDEIMKQLNLSKLTDMSKDVYMYIIYKL